MKVGIIGAGSIAGTMADTIKELNLHKSMVLRKPMALMRNWWRMPG